MKVLVALILGYLAGRGEPQLRALAARRRTANQQADPTKAELYERAQAAGIPGRSSMTKDELRDALAAEDSPSLTAKIVQTMTGREPDSSTTP